MALRGFCSMFLCLGVCWAEPDWAALGGAVGDGSLSGQWSVAGGELVGRAPGEAVAWWRAPGTYWDFELELEFKTPVPCDGGVQFRSHWLPLLPVSEGGGRSGMYGYQANIETREQDGTGAILDRNGRGRLVTPALASQETVSATDWNRLSIRAVGESIHVKVNGLEASALVDEAMIGGFVALQVAPLDNGRPGEIRYRNMRVRDLGRTGTWRALFDGKSLSGWKTWGSERWLVADRVIQGRRGPKESEGYLATEAVWTDFHVRGRFKMLGDGNYGLFFHSTIRLREDGYPIIAGVQGEVMPGRPAETGRLYESYKRGWLTPRDRESIGSWALREGEWNDIEIRSLGSRTTTWVNGIRVVDFSDAAPLLTEGSFALQLHTGEGSGIDWKDLYVLE